MSAIVDRIERDLGLPGLAALLADRLAPTDLQSLLLDVYRRRAARLRPSDVLAAYERSERTERSEPSDRNRFTRPSATAPGRLAAWEHAAFSRLPDAFERLALSPVCPLGTSSAVAGVSQDWAVATARNTEVVSDPTNVLALECASRRRRRLKSEGPPPILRLAAATRVLRAQRFDGPDRFAHFSLLALCTASRGGPALEVEAIAEHTRFYVDALRAYLGPAVRLRLAATDFRSEREALLEDLVLAPIRAGVENVDCVLDPGRTAGRGYYPGICFKLHALPPGGAGPWLELADGGAVDWLARLLSDARERLVISGIGSERVCTLKT